MTTAEVYPECARRIVDALLSDDPDTAAEAGDHRVDDQLVDWSTDAVRQRVAMLREASQALAQIDEADLGREDGVDHALLRHDVDRRLFLLEQVREHEWNPLLHNPGLLLHGLLERPTAPADHRLNMVLARLTALPDALATARHVLGDCPRVHVETAIGQFGGLATLIRNRVPVLAAHVHGTDFRPVVAAAVAAVDEFTGWLTDRLPHSARDPRLGRKLWEAKLWYTLDTEASAAAVLERAYRRLEVLSTEIRAVAADTTVQATLDRLAADHPDNHTVVAEASAALAEATTFVTDHNVVTLYADPLVVQEMPEFARGVAVAYCDAVGPLETADVPTFYTISPTPADWSAERTDSFYREYNTHMIRNLTVHEAMPGHYLQLARARRFTGSSAARAICQSGTFVEGWAVYAEQLMAEGGFGGPAVRMQQLKMQLRTTVNAILDQHVHCDDMTEADAIDLMCRRGFQEEGEVAGKWRRALLSSTQLSTYFVGYCEVAALAAARPSAFTACQWHDAMLDHGSPSPRHLRSLLELDAPL